MMNPRQFVIFLIKYFAEMIRFVKILFVAMPMIQSTISTHGICCKKETKHQPYNYFMFLFYLHLCDKRPCHSFQQPPLLCIMIKSRKYHQTYSVCNIVNFYIKYLPVLINLSFPKISLMDTIS